MPRKGRDGTGFTAPVPGPVLPYPWHPAIAAPSHPMNPWAEDRVRQLDTNTLTAFGVRLVSRHANAQEMIELLEFALAAADANVNMFVAEAFYDSGSSCCHFRLLQSALASAGEAAQQAVLSCALQTISQFLWRDRIHHGRLDSDPGEPL